MRELTERSAADPAAEEKQDKKRGAELTPEELVKTAEAMGYGAVKYYDLNKHRITNYQFSFDGMLDLRGNTAVYLLYAYARIMSIMRNATVDMNEVRQTARMNLEHPSEWALALHILRFQEVVDSILVDLLPHKLCDFLYELSCKFSDFYRDCRVLGDGPNLSRLLLCDVTANCMRQCFHLLGLTPVDKL
eukprot:TRINITY_DN175_c0_g1_i1.p2 TRINITY_DN175_c0_g1~~TRINITY_DN175_c0_g1_i1.p2  ORF type:complete len:190 (+),score=82.07 TRINITY_DN175_c0_g1_i1:261-830(+)